MDFEIEPEVCASEKGEGEELIEVIGDVLGGVYHGLDYHWFTDVEMDSPTCPLDQTDDNSRRLIRRAGGNVHLHICEPMVIETMVMLPPKHPQ